MALVSLKNLVAPVSNSVHLASIVFVVLVFAVWRWSGGEVNFVRSSRGNASHGQERGSTALGGADRQGTVEHQPNTARPHLPSRGTVEIPNEAADDLLGTILKNDQKKNTPPPRGVEQRNRSGNSLEDIERSLGIR
jgi:hypothetical protein